MAWTNYTPPVSVLSFTHLNISTSGSPSQKVTGFPFGLQLSGAALFVLRQQTFIFPACFTSHWDSAWGVGRMLRNTCETCAPLECTSQGPASWVQTCERCGLQSQTCVRCQRTQNAAFKVWARLGASHVEMNEFRNLGRKQPHSQPLSGQKLWLQDPSTFI